MLLLISIKCQVIEVYYTDFHGVDEDMMTITRYGGYWQSDTLAGITQRHVDNAPTNYYDIVAFEKKINRTYSPSGDACHCCVRSSRKP